MTEATPNDFHDALKSMNKDYSALSWAGFNLFGDEKSIQELKRLEHQSRRDTSLVDEIGPLREQVASLMHEAKRAAELDRTFDLMWCAQQRAIDAWQAAHPGKEMVWPDHADLVTWLLSGYKP